MNKEITLFGKVINGKLEVQNREKLSDWSKLQPEGADIVIKLKNQDSYYSHRQLRLIYHLFRQISEKLGYSVEDVKTILKMKHGYCYTHTLEGREVTICRSISDFNRKELSSFIIAIDLWATQELSLKLLNFDDIKFLNDV